MEALIELPKSEIGGRFKFVLRDLMGNVKLERDYKDNLFLNSGIPIISARSNWPNRIHIGSGTSTPVATQTTLDSPLGDRSFVITSNVDPIPQVAPNYEATATGYARFEAGYAIGSVSEAGITHADYGTTLAARHTFTPIPKSTDQILDVWYQFVKYPPLLDINGVVNIGDEPYNIVGRGASYGVGNFNIFPFGQHGFYSPVISNLYDGNIGATVTDTPSGASYQNDPVATYGPVVDNGDGSGYRDSTHTWSVDQGNLVNGIRSWLVAASTSEQFQIQFNATGGGSLPVDDPIWKTSTEELDLTIRNTFGRR